MWGRNFISVIMFGEVFADLKMHNLVEEYPENHMIKTSSHLPPTENGAISEIYSSVKTSIRDDGVYQSIVKTGETPGDSSDIRRKGNVDEGDLHSISTYALGKQLFTRMPV